MSKEVYKSRVYAERPAYADFDAPAKFQAINSIVERRLIEHPNAICSYSGGADSDIMIDVIERARTGLNLPPVKYVFFNTGLEMQATKDHVKATAVKYGVEIEEVRPKINIVTASRKYGTPFVSKIMSAGLEGWQKRASHSLSQTNTTEQETSLQSARNCGNATQSARARSIFSAVATVPGNRVRIYSLS